MKFKSIGDLITYYEAHYGMPYRIRINNWYGKSKEYYWWNVIPVNILRLPLVRNRWSCHNYVDEYGITHTELLINY